VKAPPYVSVVIPALDEEGSLRSAIESVRADAEVIVVDGGSRDATVSEAEAAGARVLQSSACRGLQLDVGARAAAGAWLVFLHADTRLERGWSSALRALEGDVVGGAFRFAVDSAKPGYRLIEAMVALRCRSFGLAYGDQAIFARRRAYSEVGGFPAYPLMEDVAFVRRLRRAGRLGFPAPRAFTSGRRWQRHGLVRTTLRNWTLMGLYAAGWPPQRLARLY
jgi:rSAM/selenodomain-associated transferase 2